MREMKDSGIEWIGEIPADWKKVRLKEVANIIMGQSPEAQDIKDFGNISFMQGNREFGNIYPNAVKFCDNSPKKSRIGDILLSVRAPIGAINISDKIYAIGRGLCAIGAVNIYQRFLMYFLMFIMQDTKKFGQGSTFDAITVQELKQLPIILPSLDIQHRISDYLDRKCSQIDAIVARQQDVIEKLKAYKLSVITEAVTKGLNPDVPMKDSGIEWIGEIPEHWEVGKLCFFTVRIGDGLHGTPEFDDAGEYYFINGNNLGDTYITIRENTKSVGLEEYNKYFIALNENTLLISLNGTIGNVSQYHGEQIILGKSAGYIIVDSRRELTIDYLKFYLQSKSVKTLFELSFAGTTINNLSLETLRNLPVCIMTGEEQFHIAKFLDKKCARIDQVIQRKQLTIDKLIEYKKSLIYEVVTGKKEV